MAKITIAGDAVVVTSSLKLADIKTVEKYRPETLQLRGGKDNEELIFAIGTTCGCGDISKYGASFGGETHDDEKLATITVCGATAGEDIKGWVADTLGSSIINLNKLEGRLKDALASIERDRQTVLEQITVA